MRKKQGFQSSIPLMVKGLQANYVPGIFKDLTTLIILLPSVCEGAQKWNKKFEEQRGHRRMYYGMNWDKCMNRLP